MSAFYEMIKTGLEDAIAYERGEGTAIVHKLTVEDVAHFEPKEIRQIRIDAGMTQSLFASYLGVSKKTVEAWECGRNHPDGAASRLLWITQKNPDFPRISGIIVQSKT